LSLVTYRQVNLKIMEERQTTWMLDVSVSANRKEIRPASLNMANKTLVTFDALN
jgi:hypothetical protein